MFGKSTTDFGMHFGRAPRVNVQAVSSAHVPNLHGAHRTNSKEDDACFGVSGQSRGNALDCSRSRYSFVSRWRCSGVPRDPCGEIIHKYTNYGMRHATLGSVRQLGERRVERMGSEGNEFGPVP